MGSIPAGRANFPLTGIEWQSSETFFYQYGVRSWHQTSGRQPCTGQGQVFCNSDGSNAARSVGRRRLGCQASRTVWPRILRSRPAVLWTSVGRRRPKRLRRGQRNWPRAQSPCFSKPGSCHSRERRSTARRPQKAQTGRDANGAFSKTLKREKGPSYFPRENLARGCTLGASRLGGARSRHIYLPPTSTGVGCEGTGLLSGNSSQLEFRLHVKTVHQTKSRLPSSSVSLVVGLAGGLQSIWPFVCSSLTSKRNLSAPFCPLRNLEGRF